MPALKVFLSSCFQDFRIEREKLHTALTTALAVACQRAEYLTSRSQDLEKALRECIDDADIVVLLLGPRYGSTSGGVSWTQKEVMHAHRQGKTILPYMREMSQCAGECDLALEEFERFILDDICPSIPRFSSIEELVALVVRDVIHEIQAVQREAYEEGFE
jgi:hypothetical protein